MRAEFIVLIATPALAACVCVGLFSIASIYQSDRGLQAAHKEQEAATKKSSNKDPFDQSFEAKADLASTFGETYLTHLHSYPHYNNLLDQTSKSAEAFAKRFLRTFHEAASAERLSMLNEEGFDTDGDRIVDNDQKPRFKEHQNKWSHNLTDKIRQDLLLTYDSNRDGTLQHSEMQLVCAAFAEIGPKDRSWSLAEKNIWNVQMKLRMLKYFDYNNNGLLDAVESGIGNRWMRMGSKGKEADIVAQDIRPYHSF